MQAHIENLGESALLLRLGERVDPAVNSRVHALAAALRQARPDGVDDILPAYASVLVRHRLVDPAAVEAFCRHVRALVRALPEDATALEGRLHRIPVCYGGGFGADLAALARACNLSPEAVIERHTAPEYRVAMTGFAPGFPYLIGMDERLATPRREAPRTRVPAGSVGIAGNQTGIYPSELPGGWQLIGRTPLALFDAANSDRPCLLEPGDRVRFEAIDAGRFDTWQSA